MNEMTISRTRYYRVMFYSAAVFNFSVAVSLVLAFNQVYPLMGGGDIPQAPLFNLFLQLTMGAVFLFGIMYYMIGRRLDSESSIILAAFGVMGKLFFFFIMSAYASVELIPWGFASLSFVDLFYSLLFIEYLMCHSSLAKRLMKSVLYITVRSL